MNKAREQEEYIKHVYWVEREEADQIKMELESARMRPRTIKGVVCAPLDRVSKISIVDPQVWDQICTRKGSWYRASDKSGLYLIVSSFELDNHGHRKSATITRSDFRPPRYASRQEKLGLIEDGHFRDLIPDEWTEIRDAEKRIYLRWARRLGSDVEDFDSLYLTHTANHANFVKPVFFVEEGHQVVPYSIDRSAHLCSSCLEIFQVLGQRHEKKLVAPCPGATLFARQTPDRYLLVEEAKQDE